jgi:hypothetical protein
VPKNSIVLELQREALKPDATAAALLRTAKVIASKLNLPDAVTWIDRELDGYPNVLVKDLPDYRRLHGRPQAWNPYHGWQAINAQDAKTLEFISFAPIGQAIGAIEHSLNEDRGGATFTFPYSPELKIKVQNSINWHTDVHILLDVTQLRNIVDQVKNLVLNWTIELEKAGILGEEMTFSSEERKEAPKANQSFFIQNVGVLGDVAGQASVHNQQTASANLDISKIKDLITQAAGVSAALPEATRSELQPVLSNIQTEVAQPEPNHGKLSEMLTSARKIAESASGSLAAQGIVQLIKIIVGA